MCGGTATLITAKDKSTTRVRSNHQETSIGWRQPQMRPPTGHPSWIMIYMDNYIANISTEAELIWDDISSIKSDNLLLLKESSPIFFLPLLYRIHGPTCCLNNPPDSDPRFIHLLTVSFDFGIVG
ncbi:hypothetical protein TNCV_3661901 [Trichonephila clavipes]|nr:hypothetical protein TNCV_3661901 [Trichonephila clavipes]